MLNTIEGQLQFHLNSQLIFMHKTFNNQILNKLKIGEILNVTTTKNNYNNTNANTINHLV